MKNKDANRDREDSNEIENLARKSRAILNKLTLQNLQKLTKQFDDLDLDTTEKMQAICDIVHEIAIDETTNVVTYAQLCEALKYKGMKVTGTKVETTDKPSFRRFLVNTCQRAFERDYMDVPEKNQRNNNFIPNGTELKGDDWLEKERIARKRALGNIRFIGELFRLKVLTVRIIHEVVKKLLERPEDESTEAKEEQLECLCKLIKTVGKSFEEETLRLLEHPDKSKSKGLQKVDIYFIKIKSLIDKKANSPRIRFMMQDLLELRQNRWVPRNQTVVARTIDAIHAEVKRERDLEKLMSLSTIRQL